MTGPHPDPLDPLQSLEPPAVARLTSPGAPAIYLNMDQVIAMSTALSLKRIADTLDKIGLGNPKAPDIIHGFITNLAHDAGVDFQRGVERGRR